MEEVTQRSCGWPITGSVQDQVVQGFDQPDLTKHVPTHSKVLGLDDLQWPLPTYSMVLRP